MTVVPRMMSAMSRRPINGSMYSLHLSISFAQELDQVADLDHETGKWRHVLSAFRYVFYPKVGP